MKKVSLIIPVYNTAEYLGKCLDSAVGQTYPNMEIICVDDGSTDGSEKILDRYAAKDTRIVALHQSNKGESNARNEGLKKATGDYIAFMDCDDWIEPDMYETLVALMEKKQVDMVCSGWIKEWTSKSEIIPNEGCVADGVFGQKQLLRYLYERDAFRGFSYMWNKLYRRKLFYGEDRLEVCFDENLRLGGDVLALAQTALRVSGAVYIDKAFYHYRQREESGCHSYNLEKRLDWLKAYDIVLAVFAKANVENNVMELVKRFLAYHSSNVAEMAFTQNNPAVLEHCQKIMLDNQEVYAKRNAHHPEWIKRYQKILEYRL